MTTFIMVLLHIIASIFFAPALFVTIPIHILIAMNKTKSDNEAINSNDTKKCPYCAELVKKEATVCRYCSKELNANKIEMDSFFSGNPIS